MRPPDLERAIVLIKSVFPGAEVICSLCGENPAAPASTWCADCDDVLSEAIGTTLDGGIVGHLGELSRPAFTQVTTPPPDGICAWCRERPTDGRLCAECSDGIDAEIGIPITDAQVRQLGFVSTARGWVPRTQELRDRLEAADTARTAEREAEDERIRRLERKSVV